MHWVKQISVIMVPTGLGASALMQGLADGYFVIPYTIGNYLADEISNKANSNYIILHLKKQKKQLADRINTIDEYQRNPNR